MIPVLQAGQGIKKALDVDDDRFLKQ